MTIIKANNINIYYETTGTGPDLILIGGLTTNHNIWSLMVNNLSKFFRVTTLDNRGAGQSSQPKKEYSIDAMAKDIAELMTFCQISSAFVVGHSMGGAITQKLCINYPEKVKAAVIASSIAKLPKTAQIHIESIIKLIDSGINQDLILETVFPWIYGNSFLESESNIQSELTRIKQDPYPQSYDGYVGQVHSLLKHNTLDEIANIECPTLVIVGQDDLITPIKHSKLLVDRIPNAQFEIIPDCGHMLHREQPKIFTEHIVSFFHNRKDVF
ncbi:alpha/beta fold hydrolase [Legionella nagasakiensis]|uniref:alpha/beta fold hydrolase n=1 Tax=Legionella nagasakiensis TaxID=535290 RepID=UPI0010556E1D|nr:alpha/beta hydrolase [Legionella nagasakiensis]